MQIYYGNDLRIYKWASQTALLKLYDGWQINSSFTTEMVFFSCSQENETSFNPDALNFVDPELFFFDLIAISLVRFAENPILMKNILFVQFPDVDLSKRTQIDRKHKKTLFERRFSTGSVGGMNSHAPALNLQTTGQTVVVGHHRGFSQPASATSGDPWFLQTNTSSHQMPPTAPARQHKRPAPQPGSLIQNTSASSHPSAVTPAQIPQHTSAATVSV